MDRRTEPDSLLTQFHARYLPEREHYRLLFGEACREIKRIGQGREIYKTYFFTPGARFAIDLRESNEYGTVSQRSFVCESLFASDRAEIIPQVEPGVRMLLQTRGVAQSSLFLRWLLYITSSGVDPLTCPSEVFEAAHFRLQGSRADRIPPQRLSGLL